VNLENKTTAKEIKKGPKNWVKLFWKYYLISAGIFLLVKFMRKMERPWVSFI
jgi:hypothetical protein